MQKTSTFFHKSGHSRYLEYYQRLSLSKRKAIGLVIDYVLNAEKFNAMVGNAKQLYKLFSCHTKAKHESEMSERKQKYNHLQRSYLLSLLLLPRMLPLLIGLPSSTGTAR